MPQENQESSASETISSEQLISLACDNQFLERQLDHSRQECGRLTRQIRQLTKVVQELGSDEVTEILVEKILRRCKRIQNIEHDLKLMVESTQGIMKECILLRMENEALCQQSEELRHHCDELEDRLADSVATKVDSETLKLESDRQKTEIEHLRHEMSRQKDLDAALREQMDQTHGDQERIRKLEAEVKEKNEQLKKLTDLFKRLEESRSFLLEENQKLESNATHTEDLLNNANDMISRLQTHSLQKMDEHQSLTHLYEKKMALYKEKVSALEARIQIMEEEKSDAQMFQKKKPHGRGFSRYHP